MISLSRLIKSQWANPSNEKQKVISIKMLQMNNDNESVIYEYNPEKEIILLEAQQAAENLLKQAEIDANTIHQQIVNEKLSWEQERQVFLDQAKQEGFEMGLLEGRNQGYKEFVDTISIAKEVVNSAKKDYQQQIQMAEKTILKLGMKVAEQIIGARLEENEQAFLTIVKRALKEARDYKEIQIHIHPSHYGFILSQKEELLAIFPKETDFYIYPNEDLDHGSCMIESANGRIDASIDSQLEEVKTKMLEILESEME
ncbi:MAG: flagellar assembly protein FliH [Bacillota bacterium]|nr:flagellar assembly protein FliH [Bacillota bacterium]